MWRLIKRCDGSFRRFSDLLKDVMAYLGDVASYLQMYWLICKYDCSFRDVIPHLVTCVFERLLAAHRDHCEILYRKKTSLVF